MGDEKDKSKAAWDAGAALNASLGGALAAMSFGASPLPTAAGAAAGPAVLLGRAIRSRAVERRELSAVGCIERAAEIIGGFNVFGESVAADDERLELTAKVLEAAATTTYDPKIRALARVLADGLDPIGDVDEATILALALRDLEGSHISVLAAMEEPRRGATDGREWVIPAAPLKVGEIRGRVRRMKVFDSVFAVLVRHGLVSDRPKSSRDDGIRGGSAPYYVTEVGYLCLQLFGQDPRGEVTEPIGFKHSRQARE